LTRSSTRVPRFTVIVGAAPSSFAAVFIAAVEFEDGTVSPAGAATSAK
jgi:hypothetical protein